MSAFAEYVGYSGAGTFTQSGGTNNIVFYGYGAFSLGDSSTYNLNGGLLILSSLSQHSNAAVFNFTGGTLRAGNGFSTSMPMTLGTSGGGAVLDTAGFAVSLSGPLSGPGSLAKIGSGKLVLSGSNTYTGGTAVSAGTLLLTSNSALPDGTSLNIRAGGTLIFDPSLPAAPAAASTIAAVPEPGTLPLLVVGVIGLFCCVGAGGLPKPRTKEPR